MSLNILAKQINCEEQKEIEEQRNRVSKKRGYMKQIPHLLFTYKCSIQMLWEVNSCVGRVKQE